ncbi:MAG: alpha/beta fold hydrolase [Acidobacteriota bacterium]|nr:alpha/beta fold hydrolase [Acidobacteriota bacterium]
MRKSCVWVVFFLVVFVLPGEQSTQAELAGSWAGAISIMGQELKIIVHFAASGGAPKWTIDIPQQGATGLPLSNMKWEGDKVHFELNAGPGVAVFDGVLSQETIRGDFVQAGIKATFSITKGVAKLPEESAKQKKEEPLPYLEEEVSLASGEIPLAGTLTIPEGKGPFPAVIMITGSGTQNRDEEIFGFKPFRIIADHLTRKGIAVLRCDDRGFGSQGAPGRYTSVDFASDVIAQANYLRGRKEIRQDKIGLFGHSEGGIIAPLASQKTPFAFMVLMAGTAVKGEEVLLEQVALIARADGASEAEIGEALASQKKVYSLMGSPAGEKEIEKMVADEVRKSLDKMTPEQKQAVSDPDAYVKNVTAAQIATFNSPWFRYFLAHDPAPALEAVPCPVLALFGEKDVQVSAKQNLPAMEKAFQKGGNKDVTFKVFPQANHLFLKAKTGSPSEYASLEKVFVPDFLDTISSWILEKTKSNEK